MTDFARRLPWRLGALGALLVGGISLAGGVDFWAALLRAGAAFVVFAVLGAGLRFLLQADTHSARPGSAARPKTPGGEHAQAGTHIDQTTPPMTPGDLPPPDSGTRADD